LHNLIRNSREARAGERASVTIHTGIIERNGERRVQLELWDDGPGFPEMVLEKPFEPYISNKGRGSGLGLAICRKIIAEHNGSISISNRPGGGARILVEFPLD
jgi:nitrogen fixation/metabolism regulation signal transduction histidine kinase